MNYFADSAEWRYLFRNAIDWDTLLPLYYPEFPAAEGPHSREELLSGFEQLLTTSGRWAAESVAPRARELDRAGSGRLEDGGVVVPEPMGRNCAEAAALGIFSVWAPPEYGGMGAPISISLLIYEQIARACLATSSQSSFFFATPDMLERFGEPELGREFTPRVLRGEISGSMCLTEPGAGSDLGALTTSARRRPDGSYVLNGTKRFITNAGGGLAFILARIEGAPAGLAGISLFFAEEWIAAPGGKKRNYEITKLEDKMGQRGAMACDVQYEDTVARLMGREHEGFRIMLHLMNCARLTVGLQSLGVIEAAVGYAREYATTREQFGKPVAELPLYRRNLEEWETERDAIRVLMLDTLSNYDIFQRLDLRQRTAGKLSEADGAAFRRARTVVRHRTPLVKYYGAEACALLTQRAIQALGGYGFMRDYELERLHRDSFGNLLYEGTSQIQALMALKDFVKAAISDPASWVRQALLGGLVNPLKARTEAERAVLRIKVEFSRNSAYLIMRCLRPGAVATETGLRELLTQLGALFKKDRWLEQSRFERLMPHAETLCQALSYLATLEVLARHAARDEARAPLFLRYQRLVVPRFAAIYADWAQAER